MCKPVLFLYASKFKKKFILPRSFIENNLLSYVLTALTFAVEFPVISMSSTYTSKIVRAAHTLKSKFLFFFVYHTC